MGSLGTALLLLLQLWALQGAASLHVHQEPKLLRVQQGTQVTLACQVAQAQAWEQLRVGWTKDGDILCEPYITNDSLSLEVCGPRGQLSWHAPGVLTLWLDHVTLSDSGDYVCWAVMEIPELDRANGNGTRLLVDAGLLYVLPMVGAMAAITLGAGIWGCHRRRQRRGRDAGDRPGNPLYSNVLFRPRGAPKKNEAGPGERKVPATPGKDQKGQSVYSTSFPQPVPHYPSPAPKPCPSPESSHYVPMARVSPGPGPAGQPRPRGFPEVGQESETPGNTKKTPPPVTT
ncbi:PREDICTED: transmembrane and immunoglobulin domain-containing protein 2 [Propithecus coquereli]|uniref:transmembrane and immunoglobulin domain-containing protein 2 n=1 Tax=Propithecus coquereli TaxID=379532 RepID=UPI00063F2105|nr:PREDICTED: transmembrane and immunoglobulin domain-containing protein 2 [Propithecus coquereli]